MQHISSCYCLNYLISCSDVIFIFLQVTYFFPSTKISDTYFLSFSCFLSSPEYFVFLYSLRCRSALHVVNRQQTELVNEQMKLFEALNVFILRQIVRINSFTHYCNQKKIDKSIIICLDQMTSINELMSKITFFHFSFNLFYFKIIFISRFCYYSYEFPFL